jgi:hypothetical protein
MPPPDATPPPALDPADVGASLSAVASVAGSALQTANAAAADVARLAERVAAIEALPMVAGALAAGPVK